MATYREEKKCKSFVSLESDHLNDTEILIIILTTIATYLLWVVQIDHPFPIPFPNLKMPHAF